MEEWLEKLKKNAPGDKEIRLVVAGVTILLFAIVLIDALGARGRAILAQQSERADIPELDGSGATVPSVYRVPRDLASEAVLARQMAEVGDETEDAAEEPAPAEVETAATQAAEAEVEVETAEAEAVEDEADQGEVAQTEDASDDTTEAEQTGMAEAEAADSTAEAEIADADVAQEAESETAMVEPEPAQDTASEAEVAATDPESAGASDDDLGLALLASADVSNGQRVWRQCGACHVHDAEQNRGGPHLVGIIGREVGVAEGWRYSRALDENDGVWSVDALLAWLENPDTFIPGNQMAFRGLRDEQDRIDVLGFLNASNQ